MHFLLSTLSLCISGANLAVSTMAWPRHLIWTRCGRKLKVALIALNVYQKVCCIFFSLLYSYFLFKFGFLCRLL